MKHKEMINLMGKVVVVEAVLEKVREGKAAILQERIDVKERAGWVVGVRYLPQGEVKYYDSSEPKYRIDFYDHGDPPQFFGQGDYVPCLLVVYWPTMKPVRVPMDGWRAAGEKELPVSPNYQWTDRDREYLRKEMAQIPRDAKGRWQSLHKG